jgi:leucyl aminopeptidase
MTAAAYKGAKRATIEVLAPAGLDAKRLVIVGTGDAAALEENDWVNLGGVIHAQAAARAAEQASVIADWAGKIGRPAEDAVADIALGILLRAYNFDKYKTKKRGKDSEGGGKDKENADANGDAPPAKLSTVVIHCKDPKSAEAAFTSRRAIAEGAYLARDLVNEPANTLGPVEFADRAAALAEAGIEIDVLEPGQLDELGMRALLGVAQGSDRPARVVIMQWHGGAKRSKPVCFIGKGVVFDTGGISMKPAGGMEDMKGDMAGAACVTGTMLALARRKAKVNAVGIIGLVENMPSGSAQRPGDIVTSMSGQTIEVLNTDAEGRLVLCDLIWHAEQTFKPRFMVDLATLTGAIMVALGKEYAGLFSNDDKLSAQLFKAGEAVRERVWRMPLDPAYDKMIDSKNADMKNIGGRFGGSITAAQFLQRFVQEGVAWAHIDIAGVAWSTKDDSTRPKGATAFGVRLLDAWIAETYER